MDRINEVKYIINLNEKNIFSRLEDLRTFINSLSIDKIYINYLLSESQVSGTEIEKILLRCFKDETPDQYVTKWIKSIEKYCFQGGYGHAFYYGIDTPHHWCIRPEYIGNIEISDILKIAIILSGRCVSIVKEPHQAIWSN